MPTTSAASGADSCAAAMSDGELRLGLTLTRHSLDALASRDDGPELCNLLVTVQSIAKNIGAAVRRAGISRLFGAQGSVNVQGEEQQKLDIIANQIFIHELR